MNAHWIFYVRKNNDDTYDGISWRCSKCRCAPNTSYTNYPNNVNYCSKCGAYMIERPAVKIEEPKSAYNWE